MFDVANVAPASVGAFVCDAACANCLFAGVYFARVLHLQVAWRAGPIAELKKCFGQRRSRGADCSNALCDLRNLRARRQQSEESAWQRPKWRQCRRIRLQMSCFESNRSVAQKKPATARRICGQRYHAPELLKEAQHRSASAVVGRVIVEAVRPRANNSHRRVSSKNCFCTFGSF